MNVLFKKNLFKAETYLTRYIGRSDFEITFPHINNIHEDDDLKILKCAQSVLADRRLKYYIFTCC